MAETRRASPQEPDLARLRGLIAEALDLADQLQLRMVGLHLCNALEILPKDQEPGV